MASKPPYFPFYPKDFAADDKVECMTTTGVGAYILLLCKAWEQTPPGSIPDDDLVLSRWARMSSDEWSRIRPEVIAAFDLGQDGRFHQKRMRNEYAKCRDLSKKRSAAASKRWEEHASALQEQGKCNVRASGSGSDSGSEKGVQGEEPPDALARLPAVFGGTVLHTAAFAAAWDDWAHHRQEIRKRITPTALSKLAKKLTEMGHDRAIAAIEYSIRNGWTGIFEPDGRAARTVGPRLGRVEAAPGKYANIEGGTRRASA